MHANEHMSVNDETERREKQYTVKQYSGEEQPENNVEE